MRRCVLYSSTVWIVEGRRAELDFGGSTSSVWRCGLRSFLSVSPGSEEEEDHGWTGEGGAPAAPSVPVPRPVARGLADRRQVGMLLLAPFTHGAPNLLRICAPWEGHKKNGFVFEFAFSLLSCRGVRRYMRGGILPPVVRLFRKLQQVYSFSNVRRGD